MTPPVSVIIPIGPEEREFGRLQHDLLLLPADWELIWIKAPGASLKPEQVTALREGRCIEAGPGRAAQMNAGARIARGDHLWFLHVDSGFGPELVEALQRARRQHPDAFVYARLAFMGDGTGPMWLNQRGVALRAGWLGVPFGDQGFMLSRKRFFALGGYPTEAAYGEDHLLLWQARRQGVRLYQLPCQLLTSARKYRHRGWGRLTLRYQLLWLRQALPQFWLCLRGR